MRTLVAAALGMIGTILPGAGRADPVVLELFTSQGCSSCPPADALLGRLQATEPGLLPLSLHVDYWNRIGWRDPFSSAAITARQEAYGRLFGQDGVYTPELVVDGAEGLVGSDAAAVAAAIARARGRAARDPVIPLTASRNGSALRIAIGAGPGRAQVLLLGYDDRHTTPVPSGENAGRTLVDVDVVRSLQSLADWTGTPLDLQQASPPGQHAAILLQAADGHILAAAVVE